MINGLIYSTTVLLLGVVVAFILGQIMNIGE